MSLTLRALLVAELADTSRGEYGLWCAYCLESVGRDPHRGTCELDAALSALGLPDRASRDKARSEMVVMVYPHWNSSMPEHLERVGVYVRRKT